MIDEKILVHNTKHNHKDGRHESQHCELVQSAQLKEYSTTNHHQGNAECEVLKRRCNKTVIKPVGALKGQSDVPY